MAKNILVAVFSAGGDVPRARGVQINRPEEAEIRRWLDEVL